MNTSRKNRTDIVNAFLCVCIIFLYGWFLRVFGNKFLMVAVFSLIPMLAGLLATAIDPYWMRSAHGYVKPNITAKTLLPYLLWVLLIFALAGAAFFGTNQVSDSLQPGTGPATRVGDNFSFWVDTGDLVTIEVISDIPAAILLGQEVVVQAKPQDTVFAHDGKCTSLKYSTGIVTLTQGGYTLHPASTCTSIYAFGGRANYLGDDSMVFRLILHLCNLVLCAVLLFGPLTNPLYPKYQD